VRLCSAANSAVSSGASRCVIKFRMHSSESPIPSSKWILVRIRGVDISFFFAIVSLRGDSNYIADYKIVVGGVTNCQQVVFLIRTEREAPPGVARGFLCRYIEQRSATSVQNARGR